MPDWIWSEWLIIPAILFGLIGLNLVFLIGVCLWEKYMVWPYAILDNPNSLAADARPSRPIPLSGYANLANGVARSLGFKSFGVFNDARRGIYQTCFFFWLSPARDILAVIGNGTIAKIPLQSTVLYSLLNDGTCLVSIDNPQASQTDLTGLSFEAQNLGASFNRMVEWHRERVSEARTSVQPFSERDPLADLRAFRTIRTDLLESMGLARYLDSSRNLYRTRFGEQSLIPLSSCSRWFDVDYGQTSENNSQIRIPLLSQRFGLPNSFGLILFQDFRRRS